MRLPEKSDGNCARLRVHVHALGLRLALMLAVGLGSAVNGQQYNITTLAGLADNLGNNDGTGGAARFYFPRGVAVDSSGNVFIGDYYNQTIRKITTGGVVTTLAGTANSQGSADGTGSAARFVYPNGVAVDGSGNVFVADAQNYAIRKITAGGVVTTLAGGFARPFGVAVDTFGNVFVADHDAHAIRKITAGGVVTTLAGTPGSFGSADGTGSAARFYNPSSVTVDGSGNVLVADTENHTIRKITAGGVVTTLAGTAGSFGSADGTGSAARFNNPEGVAVDGNGNVFVADTVNNTIRKITAGGVVTTVAGMAGNNNDSADGMGSAARFKAPVGVAVDGNGNLFVADSNSHMVRKGTPGIPLIFSQPQSQTIIAGSNATFTVTADGTAPLDYQWRSNGIALVSATNSSLTLTNVQSAWSGSQYSVVVSNAFGSVTSAVAVLTVITPPVITQQPQSTTNFSGRVAFFSVTATGSALTYQWRKDGTNLSGATNALLLLGNVQTNQAGSYSVVVTNLAGTVTSSAATLAVNPAPVAQWWRGVSMASVKSMFRRA